MKTLIFVLFSFLLQEKFLFALEKDKKAIEIVTEIEHKLAPKDFKGIYTFINHRSDGTLTSYEVHFSVKDIHHMHAVFVKPEREKGRQILRQKNILWTFVPSVGRAIRIADRDSFAGGDFSNADVLQVDWNRQYDAMLTKETPSQYIIDMTAKGKDATYAKMRLWVSKKDNQPIQQYFYDSSGTLLKRCLYGSVKNFGSLSRPTKLLMENVITKQKTELHVLDLQFQQKIPDSRFVVGNLGK